MTRWFRPGSFIGKVAPWMPPGVQALAGVFTSKWTAVPSRPRGPAGVRARTGATHEHGSWPPSARRRDRVVVQRMLDRHLGFGRPRMVRWHHQHQPVDVANPTKVSSTSRRVAINTAGFATSFCALREVPSLA